MKIPNRLKLIWSALWHGYVIGTISLVGKDQTKGYQQRWVMRIYSPRQDLRVLIAADMMTRPPVGDHYDAVVIDDLQCTPGVPVDPEIIQALRDSPAWSDEDALTLGEVIEAEGRPPLDYVAEDATREEREAMISRSWDERHPK